MNQTARLDAILSALSDQGSCTIADLAAAFAVSEETVRRDIRRLEQDGAVRKVHGGVRLRDRRAEAPWRQRLNVNAEAKKQIAACAADLIEPGMTLLLDSSTTAFWMAREIASVTNLTVITNSLETAGELSATSDARLFLAGGAVNTTYRAAFGAEAAAYANRFVPDLAIFSIVAIDAARGFLDHEPEEAEYARAVLPNARKTICLADASKFEASGRIIAAEWSQVDLIVTDRTPSPDIATAARESRTDILVAD
ncbi:MAG: DeoR/GlpR transcriptional regulator [Brevundimonas sp.]|uniref:DeoR/GlpR family DNA-binding transcription regulator n=1 Tax=Brevundimonas sp. TaxID=1871086 RepID=UPI001A277F14|nr:DeoR/GlpR family DNA-binding transcription regulator [Brevundimonas sp.]MBJ7319202.1 DeoR/GlpR transcriptional regulator [Brevundimonas sp.]